MSFPDMDCLTQLLLEADGRAADPGGVWPATGRGVVTTDDVRAALLGQWTPAPTDHTEES